MPPPVMCASPCIRRDHRHHARRVAPVHREQRVGHRVAGVAQRVVEAELHPLEHDAAGERVAVGVEPGGGVAEQHVARDDGVAVQRLVLLDDADDRPGQVVGARLVEARHLRGLAAGERHAVRPAAARDALDQPGDLLDAESASPRCSP